MARMRIGHFALAVCGAIALTGCEEGKDFSLFKGKDDIETTDRAVPPPNSVKLVARDVEAPGVFQVTEKGLWDGRPSLGGVWVAHSDVKDPERVIIRNEANGKFVIGALFRRERANPGPKLQISSDAAAALGMLAGAPGTLNVTALRREEVPEIADTDETTLDAPEKIEVASLDPISAAEAALDTVDAAAPAVAAPRPSPEKPAAPARPAATGGSYVQIGYFSVEANATRTGGVLKNAGITPIVRKNTSKGKDYWTVAAGPANGSAERAALLKKVKGLGFTDAYVTTN